MSCYKKVLYKSACIYLSLLTAHLIGWVRDNWPRDLETVDVTSESHAASHRDPDQCRTVLLHFDHMRSRSSYSKTIANWTSELGIVGQLVFCDRLIIALMQGTAADIKVVFACDIYYDLLITSTKAEVMRRFVCHSVCLFVCV